MGCKTVFFWCDMKRVYISGWNMGLDELFLDNLSWEVEECKENANVVLLTDGCRIASKNYVKTYTNKEKDKSELEFISWAFHRGLVIIGVGRGAQLINIYNGGTLEHKLVGHNNLSKEYNMEGYSFYIRCNHKSKCILTNEATTLLSYNDVPEVFTYRNEQFFAFQGFPSILDRDSHHSFMFLVERYSRCADL